MAVTPAGWYPDPWRQAQVRWWDGNFSEYEADRHKRLGSDADQPHRLKYKPLARG